MVVRRAWPGGGAQMGQIVTNGGDPRALAVKPNVDRHIRRAIAGHRPRAAERLAEGSSVTTHAPAIRQIVQHAHPIEVRPAHHRHRPNAPQLKQRRVTSLSGPSRTSLSGVYKPYFPHPILWNVQVRLAPMRTK